MRGQDLNLRPLGYEPNELPDCSTPRQGNPIVTLRRRNAQPCSTTISTTTSLLHHDEHFARPDEPELLARDGSIAVGSVLSRSALSLSRAFSARSRGDARSEVVRLLARACRGYQARARRRAHPRATRWLQRRADSSARDATADARGAAVPYSSAGAARLRHHGGFAVEGPLGSQTSIREASFVQ